MTTTIKLKRGSGSDPGSSDLSVGEIAIRTDEGKLFTKKDDGSVAEISGGGIDDGDKGDITVSNSGGTFTIDNQAVGAVKIADGAVQTVKLADDAVTSAKLAAAIETATSLSSPKILGSNGIMEMKQEIATSHTLTSGYNAVSVDPTVASGVTVTVPSGAVWSIV